MRKLYVLIFLSLMSGCVPMYQPGFEDEQVSLRLIDEGVLHMREGDLDAAEANFQLASELITSAAAIDGLGCIAFIRENYQEAEKLFWQAYEVDSTYNNSLGNLALLYEKTGKNKLAQEMFQRAMNEDPRNFRMRNNYAAYLNDKGIAKKQTFNELFKAQALFNHPIIYGNINKLKEN